MSKARGGILALVAALFTAVFYGRAWRFDLQCDDLLLIRPWSRAELAGVWHGASEPTHAFATFFRPLTSWFYAGAFELFGLNAHAHMLLSLAMLAVVIWLLALFVARESGSVAAGLFAAFFYAAHPNVPWSTGTWVTNDFHKLAAIVALSALLLWRRVRDKPWRHWLLLAPFAAVCFLVKEDGLMLIPALISIQWARAKIVGDVKTPGFPVIATAGLFGAALVAWRYLALRELGGFELPDSAIKVLHNLMRGPIYAFTLHGSLSVLTFFEKLVAVTIAALIAFGVALLPREQRFLPVAGLLVMFWYDLPLSLISNVTRYYMLTMASVMVAVPAFLAFATAGAAGRRAPAFAAGLMLLLVVVQTGAQRRELTVFAPCQWAEQNCVSWVLEEVKMLPPEARAYVADTARACAASGERRPHIGAGNTLTWGLGATSIDTSTGERSNTVAGDIVMLIRGNPATAPLLFRHPQASASHPVHVEVTADGKHETRELKGPEWLRIDVPLTNGFRSWMRGAHRVDTTFSRPGAEWKQPEK